MQRRKSEDKEKLYELVMNDPAYEKLDEDAYDVIAEYTNMDDIMEMKQEEQKGDKVNMCRAIREMIEDGREQGREQGIKVLIETCMEFGCTKEETEQRIVTKLLVPEETAKRYINQYWH